MSRTQKVFPPDAGASNSGATPTAANSQSNLGGNCGRGSRRFGDIRHIGDVAWPGQTLVLTPGTIASNTKPGLGDSTQDVNSSGSPKTPYPRDGASAPAAFSTPGTFGGLDSSNEGDDNFSSQGGQP